MQLSAPRANALEPEFLDDMRRGLDAFETISPQTVMISAGRNFCSGGDVARFAAAVEAGQGRAYARQVVPRLQEIVLRLVSMPAIVGVATRGAVTGGGAGLFFAADTAVMHPSTFVQPYYAQVGFAPDGGWTALLPERIGVTQSLNWLLDDRRVGAEALVRLGLGAAVDPEPEVALEAMLEQGSIQMRMAAKRLIWDDARRAALEERLGAETAAFEERIDAPETKEGMKRFLHP